MANGNGSSQVTWRQITFLGSLAIVLIGVGISFSTKADRAEVQACAKDLKCEIDTREAKIRKDFQDADNYLKEQIRRNQDDIRTGQKKLEATQKQIIDMIKESARRR